MYNYSPLKKLYIKNFRNLGEVEIDFTESPIVTLVGENEAGKTSVIKAFATCALHANPRDQKDYIRDNANMFGVAIDLVDGTRVLRIKEATGVNSYQVLKPDGTKWATNMITDGLPVEVQKVMGLIEEPETGEFLHIRTYEDKLLFVVTPNSTNYKVMYNALKVEQLTKAIKLGSVESNQLKSNISRNESSIETLSEQVRNTIVIDMTPLKSIRAKLEIDLGLLEKIESAKLLSDKIDECERKLGALGLLNRFSLSTIDELLASNLNRVSNLIKNQSRLVIYSNIVDQSSSLSEIDLSIVNKIKGLIEKKDSLMDKVRSAGSLTQLSSISEISEVEVMQLEKAKSIISKLNILMNQVSKIDVAECNEIEQRELDSISKISRVITAKNEINEKLEKLTTCKNEIEKIQDYLKTLGVAVESCPKCGEAVIFDISKLEVS